MSSFTHVLLEDGVEVELPGSVSDLITVLDQDVPQFHCQGNRYNVAPAKGSIGSHWDLIVRSFNPDEGDLDYSPVGRLEVEKIDHDMVLFRIPPSSEQQVELAPGYQHNQRIFGSFVYQVLNSFQDRKLLVLPGPLPVF
jgi:hypothetical protein